MGVSSQPGMYAFSSVLGFVNGASQGMFSGAIGGLVRDVTKLGTRLGMVYALCGVATLAGPPIMGAIVDASGGAYTWALLWSGLLLLVGGVLVLTTSRIVATRGSRGLSKLWGKA